MPDHSRTTLKVAVAVPAIRISDCDFNAEAIGGYIEKADSSGADVVVFPELCLTGSTCGNLFLQDRLNERSISSLSSLVKKTCGTDVLSVIGFPLRYKSFVYDCGAVLYRGTILGIVPNTTSASYPFSIPDPDLNSMEILGKKVPFGSGLLFETEALPGLKIGVKVGNALSDEHVLPESGENSAPLVCSIACNPDIYGAADQRRRWICTQTAGNRSAVVFANAGKGESTTDHVFSGHSMIAFCGKLLSEIAPFSGQYAEAELDAGVLLGSSQLPKDWSADQFPDTGEDSYSKRFPFIASTESGKIRQADEILMLQAQGLVQRLEHTGVKHVVLGISGGLDSTLALLVCKKAMDLLGRPAEDIIAVTMPCFGTSSHTKNNALLLCETLGIPCRTISIEKSVRQHLSDIGHAPDVADTAYENAQARERTQVLMDIANMENGLVIGTGDLSELALGFATYNGDHMSMYGVNGTVPKTLMRSMLRVIADRSETDLKTVLISIVETPVSPELVPGKSNEIGQITENIVGPYELHDFFLYHLVRFKEDPEEILRRASETFADNYQPETLRKWLSVFMRRFITQQYKRSCMPDGPCVGPISLSPRGSWIMPSDTSLTIWIP